MPWYPGAIRKPITANKGRKRLTVWNRVNLHIAVSNADSLYGYFNKTGIPDSHFYVRHDGVIEQYVSTDYQAFADLEGNDATISIETAGMATGEWSAAQRESLARLYAWAVKTHGIARKMATSSKVGSAESQGLSWHRLGIDGAFPSSGILAGRLQRGASGVIDARYMHYSSSFGKGCPTDDRIKQIPSIFKRAVAILDGGTPSAAATTEEPMTLNTTQAKQLSNCNHFVTAKIIPDFDGLQTVEDALRRLLILARRNAAAISAQSAAMEVMATSVGVDPALVVAAVEKAVTAALPASITVPLES